MNFLTICRYGHARSVALARAFHERGHYAVACDIQTNGSAIDVLSDWADVICVLESGFAEHVRTEYQDKVTKHFDIGRDIWGSPTHDALLMLVRRLADEYFDKYGIERKPGL